ncbi:MAG: SagB/ThcOx family dehydrogenase [Betaproteobacteria bacterium]|nr:SagB/ThcOx family dehydrogenase [Betaproteobacteria bacterium]
MTPTDYHALSKHRPDRYAPGPGGLDWANQPDPFRTFAGAPRVVLPLNADALETRFADVRAGRLPPAAPFDVATVGTLFELSLALSAWKEYRGTRWALRCNPSSGNLHPTEGYLVTRELPGLASGVWHYVSRDHALEQRCAPSSGWDDAFAAPGLLIGLTSIAWREAWKYGARAFRYCQHDCGHAIAAISYAAAALGWRSAVLSGVDSARIASLLGLDREADFADAERCEPEVLVWIGEPDAAPDVGALAEHARTGRWQGSANRLSREHVDWPAIAEIERATRRPPLDVDAPDAPRPSRVLAGLPNDVAAATLFRQRRSAVDFDGRTTLGQDAFFRILEATLPGAGRPPVWSWPYRARVHLVLFVHRVDGLSSGLYVLLRESADHTALVRATRLEWQWSKVGPSGLPLYRLMAADTRGVAQLVSCHQAIAAESCFSLGMLADLSAIDAAPWTYRERYWECGIVGQTLYLEAEAAGVRGTGIGCFFDDEVHELLGLARSRWQSLYHFTVGGAVDDARLTTLPAYGNRNP